MNGPNRTNRRTALKTVAAALVGGSLVTGTARAAETDGQGGNPASIVPIRAGHDHDTGEHRFEVDRTEFPAGWTTFAFENPTEHTHFAYLAKLPRTAIEDAGDRDLLGFYVEHVTRPFQWFMDTLIPGKEPDPGDLSDRYSNPEEEQVFPGWFGNVLPSGGPGFTTGGETTATTVNLAPGEYIMECYVKDGNGDFHSYHGMIEHLTVTGGSAGAPDPGPETTLELSLSTAGIDAPERVPPGRHTVAVSVEDQQVYEHLLGHDVHLVRLDGGTDVEDVSGWMNWMTPGQLVADGSEPGTFLGGAQTILTPGLLAGEATRTAYVHATLGPGEYAWVSEVPAPAGKGFIREFTVDPSAPRGAVAPADPGDSRNWGPVGEAASDDLSERAAGSRMSAELKSVFDGLANADPEDPR
jgi:hypothetical protein